MSRIGNKTNWFCPYKKCFKCKYWLPKNPKFGILSGGYCKLGYCKKKHKAR